MIWLSLGRYRLKNQRKESPKEKPSLLSGKKVDLYFGKKISAGLQNLIACYKEIVREQRKIPVWQTSSPSYFRTPQLQPSTVNHSPSNSGPHVSPLLSNKVRVSEYSDSRQSSVYLVLGCWFLYFTFEVICTQLFTCFCCQNASAS